MYRIVLFLLCVAVSFGTGGCSRDQMSKLGSKDDLCYPGKAAVHVVELNKVRINDKDFTTTEAGDPRPLRVYLLEDDALLEAEGGSALSGTRGERELDPPLRWLVNFGPETEYQIVVEEDGEGGMRYEFPPKPRPGFWPVPANDFTFRMGKGSYVRFTEDVREAN